jgi:hypothetical protein
MGHGDDQGHLSEGKQIGGRWEYKNRLITSVFPKEIIRS